MTVAVYPGTFDPITNGHTDILRRALKLFDKVILAVAENARKKPFFDLNTRVALAQTVLEGHAGIEIHPFKNLLVEFATEHKAKVILRGLRAVSDFEMEFQLASVNRRLRPEMETLFLIPSEKFTFLSSSLVKEMANLGGDVSAYVHPVVSDALLERFASE